MSHGSGIDGRFISQYNVERTLAEKELYQNKSVLEAINEVLIQSLKCNSEMEVAQTCLDIAEKLTGSKFGFIGELNKNDLFDTIAISDLGWKNCRI